MPGNVKGRRGGKPDPINPPTLRTAWLVGWKVEKKKSGKVTGRKGGEKRQGQKIMKQRYFMNPSLHRGDSSSELR